MHYVGYIVVGFLIFIGYSQCKEIPLQYELDNINEIDNESLTPHSRTRRCEYNNTRKIFLKKYTNP